MKIIDVEGIGTTYADKLKAAGIDTTEQFLTSAGTQKGRQTLEDSTGISAKLLLEWANHVDLMRIDGVGSEFSDLLEAAGVDSCPELAQRNATSLIAKMTEINEVKSLTRRLPTEAQVAGWIKQAGDLPKIVTH
ncbi:MAG: hypothetical protein QOJ92_1086 [Frankiales bacterium]|nr:hypothetical protein [Frankiales bacterium]